MRLFSVLLLVVVLVVFLDVVYCSRPSNAAPHDPSARVRGPRHTAAQESALAGEGEAVLPHQRRHQDAPISHASMYSDSSDERADDASLHGDRVRARSKVATAAPADVSAKTDGPHSPRDRRRHAAEPLSQSSAPAGPTRAHRSPRAPQRNTEKPATAADSKPARASMAA